MALHRDNPTRAKAKIILKEGEVRGKSLTKKQKGFFGARAGGEPVRTAQVLALKRKK